MSDYTEWCEFPKTCVYEHTCARNLDNLKGPYPPVRVYKKYVCAPDQRCPGFLSMDLTPEKKPVVNPKSRA